MITKIFNTIKSCTFDSTGLNMEWLNKISVDERSMLKKFFRDSGPQFCNLLDFWVEEFCRRVQAEIVPPGTVLKDLDVEPDRLIILIKGKVSVEGPLFSQPVKTPPDTVLINEYYPGQSFGDPFLNETTAIHNRVTVGSKPAKIFYLMKSNYLQIYIDRLNDLNNTRI